MSQELREGVMTDRAMTVKELIKALQRMPPDALVYCDDANQVPLGSEAYEASMVDGKAVLFYNGCCENSDN